MRDGPALKELHRRAVEVTPGMIGARRRGDTADMKMLQNDVSLLCKELGLSGCHATSVLWLAAMQVADSAIQKLAEERGQSHEDVIRQLSLAVARGVTGE